MSAYIGIALMSMFLMGLAIWLVWSLCATYRDNLSPDGPVKILPRPKGKELIIGRMYLVRADSEKDWKDSIYMGLDLDGYRWFLMPESGKEVGFQCKDPDALFEAPKIKYVWAQPLVPDRINAYTGRKI